MSSLTTILHFVEPYEVAITLLIVYIAEHIFPQRKELFDVRHDLKNLLFGIINLTVALVGGFYLQKLLIYSNSKNFGLLGVLPNMGWLRIVTGFVLLDIFMYWWHRVNHTMPLLWRFHKFHHKDEKLNSTSAIRFHAVEITFSYLVRFLVFPLIGFTVPIVILYAIGLFPVIVFHHSNIKVSTGFDNFCRNIFVTPVMHRIHHSKIVSETNSNYGSIFPYWDALFKTYISKPEREIEFGVESLKT